MIRLRQGTPGKVYTVSWVKGGGRIARPLEERGVVAGVDVTLLSLTPVSYTHLEVYKRQRPPPR